MTCRFLAALVEPVHRFRTSSTPEPVPPCRGIYAPKRIFWNQWNWFAGEPVPAESLGLQGLEQVEWVEPVIYIE